MPVVTTAQKNHPSKRASLERMARSSRNVAAREEASAAARRMRFQILRPESASVNSTDLLPPDLETLRLSSVDGDGSQLLALTRRWDSDHYLIIVVYWNDSDGIRDIMGVFERLSPEIGDQPLEELMQLPMVDIDLPAARGALAAALEMGIAQGRKMPPHYEIWEPYFHDRFPPSADEHVAAIELDDGPFARRHDLALKSSQLLDHPAFASWLADPEPIVESIGLQFLAEKRAIPESRYAQLARELFDSEMRALLRGRLRRQAWLLGQQHEGALRDIALAAAAELAESSPQPPDTHPLLRGMIDRSLDVYLAAPFIGLL